MFIGKILKLIPNQFANPYTPDMPISSPEHIVLKGLDWIYTKKVCVFVGKISDHKALAAEVDYSARDIEEGFQTLQELGYLTIDDDGDTFTPTEKYLWRVS